MLRSKAEAGNRKDKKEGRLCAVAQPAFFAKHINNWSSGPILITEMVRRSLRLYELERMQLNSLYVWDTFDWLVYGR